MKELKAALSDNIFLYIDLYTFSGALQVRETSLSHKPIGDDTSGDAHLQLVGLQLRSRCRRKFVHQCGRRVRPAKLARERVKAQCLDLLKFLLTLLKLVPRLKFQ